MLRKKKQTPQEQSDQEFNLALEVPAEQRPKGWRPFVRRNWKRIAAATCAAAVAGAFLLPGKGAKPAGVDTEYLESAVERRNITNVFSGSGTIAAANTYTVNALVSGTVLTALFAPGLAAAFGWGNVFGLALIPLVLTLIIFASVAKNAPERPAPKSMADYLKALGDRDSWWFMFFYSITFGGFLGLASTLPGYFHDQYGFDPVKAGYYTAACVFAGSLMRPLGGALADRIGGNVIQFFLIIPLFLLAGTLMVQGGLMGNGWPDLWQPAIWQAVAGTRFGSVWIWQILLAWVALAIAWLNPRAISYFGFNLMLNLAIPIALATIAQMFIIAVNEFDGAPRHPGHAVRKALALADNIPVVTVDARQRQSARDALITVTEYALTRLGAPA